MNCEPAIVHADGRRWTDDELEGYVVSRRMESGMDVDESVCHYVSMFRDLDGRAVVVDTSGDLWTARDGEDMEYAVVEYPDPEPLREVWLVWRATGEWSDYMETVESVWSTEAGAVSHVVRDIGAEFADAYMGRFRWTNPDEDDFWDDGADYYVERKAVRYGE